MIPGNLSEDERVRLGSSRAGALLLLALILCGPMAQAQTGEAPPAVVALDRTTKFLYNEAYEALEKVEPDPAFSDRRLALARATTFVNFQPVTEANLAQVAEQFRELIKQDPSDDAAVAAKYFLARLEHVHAFQPDLERATELYREVFEQHPETFYGQLGAVKYAIAWLIRDIPQEEQRRRIEALELLAPRLTLPPMVRDFHEILGKAHLRFKISEEKALEHFIIAERAGFERYTSKADALVKIGELARRLGRKDLARDYYSRFVRDFVRDDRNYTIRKRLEELDQS